MTHARLDFPGRVFRRVLYRHMTQHSVETNIHTPSEILNRNPILILLLWYFIKITVYIKPMF